MLKVQKRSAPFFHQKLFFSFCSTRHLKRSSDKFAEDFWPKVQKSQKKFIRKNEDPPIFSPDTRKAVTNRMPKFSTQHPTKWLARSTWTIKVFFTKVALRFSFRARREQFWLLRWVFLGKQLKTFPQNPESFCKPQTRPKNSSKNDSGHVQLSSDKPVVSLWPKEWLFFVRKRNKVKHQTSQRSTCTKSTINYSKFAPGLADTSFDNSQEIVLQLAWKNLDKDAKFI